MRHHLPTNGMQALREGVLHRDPFPLLLCHHRRGVPAGHQRGGKQVGAAQHLRTGVDGADTTGPPAVYPPLEPEPLRGALPNDKYEVIGEKRFPGHTYDYHLYFIGKKGLYLSLNNLDNPIFSEDELMFQCFTLEDIK